MKFKQSQGRKDPIEKDRILWCKTFDEKEGFEIARIFPSLIIVGFVCMNELRINEEKIRRGKILKDGKWHGFFLGDAYKEMINRCMEEYKNLDPGYTLALSKKIATEISIKYLLPLKNIGDK